MTPHEPRVPIVEVNLPMCPPPTIEVDSCSAVEISNYSQSQWIETISSHLTQISDNIGSLPEGSFILALVGALSSVIAAFIFNLVYWKIVNREKRLVSAIVELETVIVSLERIITEYWLHPYNKRHKVKNNIQEIRMTHDIAMLEHYKNRLVKQIPGRFFSFSSRSLKKGIEDEISEFILELYITATSDDFESLQRQQDLKKVSKVIQLCSKMKITLSGLKR
ncbi:TPA: hypothetical protein I7183_09885 [Vibrio vulnificus]|nr:hypothetical protein [Vibrio vulnificus]